MFEETVVRRAVNNSEKVVYFLQRNLGLTICDECLRRELDVASSISSMCEGLNPHYSKREVASCQLCGEVRMTTTSFAKPSAADIRALRKRQREDFERFRERRRKELGE